MPHANIDCEDFSRRMENENNGGGEPPVKGLGGGKGAAAKGVVPVKGDVPAKGAPVVPAVVLAAVVAIALLL